MLQACLNGGRAKVDVPGVPTTPDELAADAAAVVAAGAQELHVHPRSADGAESLEPGVVAACLRAIRNAAPGVPVGVGTGAWIAPGGRARLAHVEAWSVLPDYASVNIGEADAAETIDLLLNKGVGVEAGVWNRGDAARLARLPTARRCLRMLLEMTSDDPVAATAEYRAAMGVLREVCLDLPILLHGEGGSVWPMVRLAVAEGHATRVGLEDGLTLPDGTLARSNAAMVKVAVGLGAG